MVRRCAWGCKVMDIRIKTVPFEFQGKTYTICCNMNVLADVQEAFDGDLDRALQRGSSVRSVLEFLAAMLNDSADSNGWPERFTARQLGRMLPAGKNQELFAMVMDLVASSCSNPEEDSVGDDEKNVVTRQSEGLTLPGT